MKKWTLVLGSFLLMVSFQNCQKSALNDPSSDSSSSASNYQKTAASDFQTVQMWNYQSGKNYDVDVQTGRVAAYSGFGSDLDGELCLNDAERQEIQGLIAQSEVCQPVLDDSRYLDRACTAIYQSPYAVLIDGSTQVRLGEKTSGCDVPADLCGTNGQALQDFVRRVLNTIEQRSCQ